MSSGNKYIDGAIIRALAQLARDQHTIQEYEPDTIDRGLMVHRAKNELDFLKGGFPKHIVKKRKKKRIKVNRHNIDYNRRHDDNRPPLSVDKSGEPVEKGHEIIAFLPGGQEAFRVVYQPDKPLGCGATVWIETNLELEVRAILEQGGAAGRRHPF